MGKPKNMTPEQEAEWKAKRAAHYKAYREANRERFAERDKAYREANRERKAEYAKAYREANRERKAEYAKAYREANRERIAERKKARRFRKTTIINHLLVHQRGKCAICHTSVIEKHHLDHIAPLAKGGTNDRENLQLLCPKCNMEKAAADPIEFAQRKGKLL